MIEKVKKSFETISLPPPQIDSHHSLERMIYQRRSIREYSEETLTLSDVSQLLWSGQGITDPMDNYRAVPSAGALYPLELYLITGNVQNLSEGIYRYHPSKHELAIIVFGEKRSSLSIASLRQDCVRDGAVTIAVTAVFERTRWKYGNRSERYICMEVGHVCQNISLQAEALNLGTVVVGAFNDSSVTQVLDLPDNEIPLCLIPIGKKQN